MKRFVTVLACVAIFLIGCAKPSDELVGNWKLDLAMTLAQLQQDFGVDQILTLKSDGTFTITVSADAGVVSELPFTDSASGTWKFEDNVLTLSDAGGIIIASYVQFSYDRKTITLTNNPPLIFNKM